MHDGQDTRQITKFGDVAGCLWSSANTVLFSSEADPETMRKRSSGELVTDFYEVTRSGECKKAFSLPLQGASIAAIENDKYLIRAAHQINRPDFLQITDEDGRRKAYTGWKNPPYSVYEEIPFWYDGNGTVNGVRSGGYLYDRTCGECIPITPEDFYLDCFSIHEGKVVYSGTFSDNGVKREKQGMYLYSTETQKTDELISPGNDDIYCAEFVDGELILAIADGTIYGRKLDPDFYSFDIERKQRNLIAHYDRPVGIRYGSIVSDSRLGDGVSIKAEGKRLYFLTISDGGCYINSIDKNGRFTGFLTPDGSADNFDVSGSRVVYCGLYNMKLPEIYEDGAALTKHNAAVMAKYNVVKPVEHTFADHDGYMIHGWCLKPADFQPGKKYPGILCLHGGPRCAYGPVFHHEMQVYANAGYFVFFCNPRGSDGYGDDFAAAVYGRYGQDDYKNLMQFMDTMLKEYPGCDRNRLGVTGGSYGGFMVNWIVGHTDRFRAASSQRSISNWITHEFISDMGYSYGVGQLCGSALDNAEHIWNQSPLKYAKHVKTPVLFINSDQDFRCWYADAIQMFSALKVNGVDTKFCLFKGESHDLSRTGRPRNRELRLVEMLGWFDHYLKE